MRMEFIDVMRKETKKLMDKKGVFRKNIDLDPKTPIQDLELSLRLKNILLNNNIKFVSQLEHLTLWELPRMKGMGQKSIIELQDFQYQYRITEFNRF